MKKLDSPVSILNQKTHSHEKPSKVFSDQSLVPRTGAAAVSLRPVDDGCGLAAETHDLLDSPSEEHGERVACHLLGMIHEFSLRACWRIYGVHLFGFKESVLFFIG